MTETDTTYFRRRADAEMALARAAPSPDVAAVHVEMAAVYVARISGGGGDRLNDAKSSGARERPTLHLSRRPLASGNG